MAGGRRFPLDGAFAELRQVVEEARDALSSFKAELSKGVGARGSSGSSGSRPGPSVSLPSPGAANASARGIDQLAAAQGRAAKSARDLSKATRDASGAMSGLGKAAQGAAGLARALGFDELSSKIDKARTGLRDLGDLVVGLRAGVPALAALGAAATAVVGVFGLLQEGVGALVGRTLSMKNAAGLLALSLAGPVVKAAKAAGDQFAAFAAIGAEAFNLVSSASKSMLAQLRTVGNVGATIRALPAAVKSMVPGLEAIGDAMASLGPGQAIEETAAGLAGLESALKKAGKAGVDAFQQIRADLDALGDGIVEQQTKLLNEGGQGPGFLTDPLGALMKAIEDSKALYEQAIAAVRGAQSSGPAPQSADRISRLAGNGFGADDGIGAGTELPGVEKEGASPFEQFKTDLAGAADLTQQTFDFIESGVNGLSSTIATSLVDAFVNPAKDARQAFAEFFADLAVMILQTLIKALVLKAILSAINGVGGGAGGATGGLAEGGEVGLALGGPVPSRGRPSLAHYLRRGVRGLAAGGPPPGVPASDTVPAWLTPGEFVEPVRAVKHYGKGFMEAVRTLSFPRDLAHAFSGFSVPQAVMTRAPGPRGYAEGGPVAAAGGGGGGATIVQPALIANEQTFGQLLDGGSGALERHMQRNPAKYRKALGL